jgi:hypothetical protein
MVHTFVERRASKPSVYFARSNVTNVRCPHIPKDEKKPKFFDSNLYLAMNFRNF